MRYFVLATDYDGTLAQSGKVAPATIAALERLKASGRRIILVTGRRLNDLMRVFPEFEILDYIVAENGALVYQPATRWKELLAEPVPSELIRELELQGIQPLEIGEVIVATHTSNQESVLKAIYQLEFELQITFNGESTMIVPQGIGKAVGMERALNRMGLSFHEVVGIGNSQNDYSLLKACECSIAVANATERTKEIVAHVTQAEDGEGVNEMIAELLESDLARLAPKLTHNHIELGKQKDGKTVWMPAYGQNLLIAGPSGSGKSTFATGFIERLLERKYQVCIIDPEGDYGTLQDVAALGSSRHPPSISEILGILENPRISISINLLGVPLTDRPEYLSRLLPSLQTLRSRTGRPQWILIDEAHHVLPSAWGATALTLPRKLGETIFLTVHPEQLAREILQTIDTVVAVGATPNRTLFQFSEASGASLREIPELPKKSNEVVTWMIGAGQKPIPMEVIPGHSERLRHLKKYAEGDLGKHSFYFTGPKNKLRLKAQNLMIFSQISEGLDEETWAFHFKRGDYSKWFKERIKDQLLSNEMQRIEKRKDLNLQEARSLMCELIRARYTI